jgi:hypothetical protein
MLVPRMWFVMVKQYRMQYGQGSQISQKTQQRKILTMKLGLLLKGNVIFNCINKECIKGLIWVTTTMDHCRLSNFLSVS